MKQKHEKQLNQASVDINAFSPSEEDALRSATLPISEIMKELSEMGVVDVPIPSKSAFYKRNASKLAHTEWLADFAGKSPSKFRRTVEIIRRESRVAGVIARALLSPNHPVLAHVIPMRQCNLACAYCNEYDDFSAHVPTEEMFRRLDKLGEMKTSIVTISGGEPMMHPEIFEIVAHVRKRGMIAGLITNGFYLTPEKIRRFNEVGLEYLQIGIDNVEPDEISKKSLKLLDKRLVWLAEHANFHVNINSVIGGGIKNPEDALVIGRRALELGFSTTTNLIHDGQGILKPLADEEQRVYRELKQLTKSGYARLGWFQDNLAANRANDWKCRAGARYLYICEDGLVHYCSQQRGFPGIPLADYTMEDFRREYNAEKPCAPLCTVACSHKVAILDNWRNPQKPFATGQPTKEINKKIIDQIVNADKPVCD